MKTDEHQVISPQQGDRTKALVEHYQKTYEFTYVHWQQRNRTFILLLLVVAAETLLAFSAPGTQNSVLSQILGAFIGLEGDSILKLQEGLHFALFQIILLMVVFYLMVNLYHRATYVLRNYRYLSLMESEIRRELKLLPNSIAFTRESTFYWSERRPLAGAVKWIYIVMLGLLFSLFFGGRFVDDANSGGLMLVVADIVIAIPTAIFYIAYARSSVGLDSKSVIVGDSEEQ